MTKAMTRRLFSSFHLSTIGTGMCLLVAISSPTIESKAFEETPITVTLTNVSNAIPGSLVEIDIEITWPDSLDTLFIDGFSFAIAYDSNILQLDTVFDNGLKDDSVWFFEYLFSYLNRSEPPNMVVQIVGADTVPAAGIEYFISGKRTITLLFETSDDSSLTGSSTTVDFYWQNCDDNIIWKKDHDTTLLALQVLDADGEDVPDEGNPLPSFAGPDSICFDPVSHGGSEVVRSIRFHSGKIELVPTDVVETQLHEDNLPARASLRQNYPNPFNPSTSIEFYLSERTGWRLEIINMNGQIVTEFSGVNASGNVTLSWDGRDRENRLVSSGVYFYRLVTEMHTSSRKMLLLR